MNKVQKIINTQDLITIPAVATKVLTFMDQEDVSLSDLSSIIETDHSLSLKIIKVSNSSLYATRVSATNITQAVQNLGMNRVSNIVLGVSIFSKFMISKNKVIKDYLEKFWWHSACTATVAKSITKKLNKSFNEQEFLISLIHDIGKLIMMQYDFESFIKVVKLIEFDNQDPISVEEKFFDTNHKEVGLEILKKWQMPERIIEIFTLSYDKEQDEDTKLLISIIKLADYFCEIWGADFYGGVNNLQLDELEAWKIIKNYSKKNNYDMNIESFTLELENEFKNSSNILSLIIS